jgi:transketolase
MTAPVATDLERLAIDTVRTLSMDAVQRANSGHPGMPMAMAPLAYILFREVMNHDPRDPQWPDRDRFVLSAGHGSMWLYAALHLSGYDLSLDDIKQFRQWGSITPGHPERDRVHVTPGVEVTTGPLGQGFANGVGLAMAERFLRERYGEEVQNHRTYVVCSDGDLMEGIASEAASLAGKLGLGRMIYMYDDNSVSLDGPTSLSFDTEDVTKRFEAYGWHVSSVEDVNDLDAVRAAITAAQEEEDRPSLIRIKTIIGWPAPNKMGTSKAHGSPLGEDEVRLAKEALGWDPDAHFLVPDGVYEAFSAVEKGAAAHAEWNERYEAWRAADEARAAEWDAAWRGEPMPGFAAALPTSWEKDKLATRAAGQQVMATFGDTVPTMVGGAADLSESTKTEFTGQQQFTREHAGRNVFFGVREHGMGGTVNGMAAHGGIVRPYGSTFLQFSDYMRGAVRLSALMALNVAWVWTHDSVALGEDGPTHQPVEHLAALRAIPGLVVLRPADAAETTEAWRTIIEDIDGPAALILSRQDLPVLDRDELAPAAGVARGAYVLADADDADPEVIIVATGSEVWVALEAAKLLDDLDVRVVSMPSWELFERQDEDYQDEVLPEDVPTVSVEAAVSMGWERWADEHVSIERFGASAPGTEVLERFGFTPEHVAEVVRDLLDDLDQDD